MGIHEDLNIEKFKTPQIEAALNVMHTGYWLAASTDRVLKPLGLSEPQFNALSTIYAARGEAVSASQIKAGMIQAESNVTRIVDRLLRRGWVTRKECPVNRRKVDIRITEEGRKAFKKALDAVMGLHKSLESRLSVEESRQVSVLLDRLRTNGKSAG